MILLNHAAVIDFVDTSYDLALEESDWIERLMSILMLGADTNSCGFFRFRSGYRSDGSFWLRPDGVCSVGPAAANTSSTVAAIAEFPTAERLFGRSLGTSMSSGSGLGATLSSVQGFRACWREPIIDVLGLVGRDADGSGACISVGLDRLCHPSPRQSRAFSKIAIHLCAGDRLRRKELGSPLNHAEAILGHDGRVLHAEAAAQNARDSIDIGRRRRDFARASRHDGEKALEVWEGLIEDRWSLIDHFDTDGKRFVLAIKNSPEVDRRNQLTDRERRISALAAMGHRDKEIAYTLGLSNGAVAACLHRARVKLGVNSRAELARIWRRGE
jgi:DNA-binding CsgD family transcriptional regulator